MAQLPKKKIKTVAFMIAMEPEAKPFIDANNLQENNDLKLGGYLAMKCYSGEVSGTKVHCILNGNDPQTSVSSVGTVPAALATFCAIESLQPDLLINAGTAGGFKARGAEIGDIYLSDAVKNHDRRIPLPGGFVEYGHGHIDNPCDIDALASKFEFKKGVVTTGNSLDATDTCREIMDKFEAHVKDMEAAAIGYVATQAKVPWFCLKSVTDIVDGGIATPEEFQKNLQAAAESLQKALPQVLEHVIDMDVATLLRK